MPQTQAIPNEENAQLQALPEYSSILLAADSSDHANRGTEDAASIASLWDATITGSHVYAARMHDIRFRQMEGGLPEQFRQEEELERQRVVHDDLISRGLSIITDSYLDQIDRKCEQENISFKRSSLEGKNYRELSREANTGKYDLLIMGAQGLGAIKGSSVGTVCERVSRRSELDTLIIKNPKQALKKGPIVVAVDGSHRAYGGLLRGIALAKNWRTPLHVISAFDPYYHYVAFNRIAGVLSEEAGKVFRFQEQEQLHEEIIDSGLAKIYDGHLCVAQTIADDYEIEIQTKLLDGKPWDAILKYTKKTDASLLIVGKTGIHADDALDIGGNTENLLRMTHCALLMSHLEHQPQIERLADVTTSWTEEAKQRMQNVPSFVQNMARAAILRYAQERGHTVITESIVEQATKQLMPGRAEQAMEEIVEAYDAGELKRNITSKPMQWSIAAQVQLEKFEDESLRNNLAMRAEKKARSENVYKVELAHIEAFLELETEETLAPHWQAGALARLSLVPEGFMRETSQQRIEDYATKRGFSDITFEVAEAGLAESRQAMEQMMQEQQDNRTATGEKEEGKEVKASICPFARAAQEQRDLEDLEWTQAALDMLDAVPIGFCRDMTHKAAASIAAQGNIEKIDSAFIQDVLDTFTQGSGEIDETLPWDKDARQRLAKAPEMVKGMLVKEIETWLKQRGDSRVDYAAVEAAKQRWETQGVFHMTAGDPRNRE